MKKIINIKTGMCILLLTFTIISSSVYSQQVFNRGERQPFNSQSQMLSSSPSRLPPPPKEDDAVGHNPAPVGDVQWLLPLLAVGYGIYNRQRKMKAKN